MRVDLVDGVDLGRELVEAVLAGKDEAWMRAAFVVIERALDIGTLETQNLVAVGLFEAMQGPVYDRATSSEVMDSWLGLLSQTAWADLIEGWTGNGIRTIAAWRGVIINGPRHLVELRAPGFDLACQLAHAVYPPPAPGPLDALPNRLFVHAARPSVDENRMIARRGMIILLLSEQEESKRGATLGLGHNRASRALRKAR